MSVCCTTADTSITPAALSESSHTNVNAADDAVGFMVLGEVEPRTFKKVCKIGRFLRKISLLENYCTRVIVNCENLCRQLYSLEIICIRYFCSFCDFC